MCVNNNEATEPCVAGKFSVTCQINVMSCLSYNECRNCPSGWQGLGGDSSCVECETGRYQDQTSQSVCKICENGRYNALSKQILPSTCLACSPGQVSKNDNGAAMCIKCIPGMFAAGEAFSTCTDCAKGRYMEKEGQSFCRICQTGQFVNLTGSTICFLCLPGKALSEGTSSVEYHDEETDCTPCEPLSYAPIAGVSDCWKCLGGEDDKFGSTICNDGKCDPGEYRMNSECFQCPLGQYQTMRLAVEYNPSDEHAVPCNLCPSGFFGHPNRLRCKWCNRGTFGNVTGANSETSGCFFCRAGRFSEVDHLAHNERENENVPCDACIPGQWSSDVAATEGTTCKTCSGGFYSEIEGANTIYTCKRCKTGKYNDRAGANNILMCINCPRGYEQNNSGAEYCIPCMPGKNNGVEGAPLCIDCTLGRYSDITANNETICTLAVGSNFVSSGKTSTVKVPGGYRMITCLQNDDTHEAKGCINMEICPSGSYGNTPPSGICNDCPIGFASTPGLQHCNACSVGKFSPRKNMMSCVQCPIGFHSPERTATDCDRCISGRAAAALGSSFCDECVSGTYSSNGDPCIDCPVGWIQSEVQSSTCHLCPIGFSTNYQSKSKLCLAVPLDQQVAPPKLQSLRPFSKQEDQKDVLVLSVEFTSIELADENIEYLFVEWSSINNLADIKSATIHPDYRSVRLKKPIQTTKGVTSEAGTTFSFDLTPTSMNNNNAVSKHQIIEGRRWIWSKPIYMQATYILNSGGTGRISAISQTSVVVSDCRDKEGFQWYLRTHPHDDICEDPIGLLGLNRTDNIRCVQCPIGGSCNCPSGVGMFLNDVVVRQGYWKIPWGPKRGDLRNKLGSLSEAPHFFARCPNSEACIGVSDTAFFNTSGWFDKKNSNVEIKQLSNVVLNWTCPASNSPSICMKGTEGTLCAVCSNDYTRIRGTCQKCSPLETRVSFSIALLVPIILLMSWLRRNLRKLSSTVRNALRDMNRILLIVINLAQIASALPYSIDVAWPSNVIDFLALFEIMDIDLASITGATCNKAVDFRIRFMVMSMAPPIILFIALSLYCNGRAKIKKELKKLNSPNKSVERAKELEDCHTDLFRIIDVDRSGSIDSVEFLHLLKLVGFKRKKVDQRLALKLIHKITGSKAVNDLSMGAFVSEMKDGGMGIKIETLLEQHSANQLDHKRSFVKKKIVPKKRNSKRKKRRGSILHNVESNELLTWNRSRKLIGYSLSWAMQALLLLHTPISRKVFEYFDCKTIGIDTYSKSFLRVDYSFQCQDGNGNSVTAYKNFLPVIFTILLGFTLLLPVSLSMFLVWFRNRLYQPNVLLRMGWMYERLTRGAEFWEIHELLRKMILTGVIVFFPPDPAIRSCLAMLVCIAAQCSLSYFKPHRNHIVFWTEQLGFAVTLFLYVCAVAFQAQMDEASNDMLGKALIVLVSMFNVGTMGAIAACLWQIKSHLGNKDHLTEGQLAMKQHEEDKKNQKKFSFHDTISELKRIENQNSVNKVKDGFEKSLQIFEMSITQKKISAKKRLYNRIHTHQVQSKMKKNRNSSEKKKNNLRERSKIAKEKKKDQKDAVVL